MMSREGAIRPSPEPDGNALRGDGGKALTSEGFRLCDAGRESSLGNAAPSVAPTYALVNLGCKVNRVESDGFEALLQREGFRSLGPSQNPEEAALVVVNTCTVTGEAEKKTRKAVRQALKVHPSAQVVVTGCASAISPETFLQMDDRVTVVPKAGMALYLRKMAPSIRAREPEGFAFEPIGIIGQRDFSYVSQRKADCVSSADGFATAVAPSAPHEGPAELSRTRRGVKVQDGCDNACTYCIVHVARGAAVSRPAPEIMRESLALAQAGVGEVVLSGINLGSYRFEGLHLHHLLQQLLEATNGMAVRFRVSSIEPMDVEEGLIDLLAESEGRLCRHLHLPLQSGCAKVLEEMGRPYGCRRFEQLVERLYEACPTLALSTDIIAGFPGETDAEFEETLEMARVCRFAKIHAFPYSRREGTPAAARTDQVPAEEKSRRARRLRQLAAQLRREDFTRRAGTWEWAVVEEPGRACTESYYEIEVPRGHRPGELIKATIPPTFIA